MPTTMLHGQVLRNIKKLPQERMKGRQPFINVHIIF